MDVGTRGDKLPVVVLEAVVSLEKTTNEGGKLLRDQERLWNDLILVLIERILRAANNVVNHLNHKLRQEYNLIKWE